MSHPPENPQENSDLHDDLLKYWDTANAQSRRYKSRFRSTETAADQPIERIHRNFDEVAAIVWFQPSVKNYRDVLHDTDIWLKRSSIWVAVSWGIQFLLALCLASTLSPDELTDLQGREVTEDSEEGKAQTNVGSVLCAAIICLPLVAALWWAIYMIFGVGIPHIAAQLFGGEGILEETAFLYAAVYAFASPIASVLNLLWQTSDSVVVLFLLVLFGFYVLGLLAIAIRAAHHLNWAASVVSVLALPIVAFGLVFACSLFS